MNGAWPVWLALALLLPLAARRVSGRGGRPGPGRRAAGHLLHLSALAACALLAACAGGPRAAHLGWDRSTALITMLTGLLWVEGALLVGRRAPPVPDAPAWGRGDPMRREDGAVDPEKGTPARVAPSGTAGAADGHAALSQEAEALLARIQTLDRLTVEAIMTPRERMVLADSTDPLASTLRRMRQSGRTRLPVAAGSADRILGVLHAKDLVPLALRDERPASLRRHLRRYLHVPRGQSVARLLEDFRRHRVHVGIVTDPMGTTLGLVTMTDVFRFIAGTTTPGDPAVGSEGR